ncbi:MAG TPA: FGGY family carbohydrate kinase, partial [Polyangiaceae bacterium]|nr:FGGY family carbohydrate kinase [Polyangiaceae bacterium]
MSQAFLGVDVGTGSVRAGLFDAGGRRLGQGVEEIRLWRPEEDFVEQSSEDIWQAAGRAIAGALAQASLLAEA